MSTATLSSALPRPHAYTSEFSELLGRIKDGKLLDRTVGYYITLMVVLGIALLGGTYPHRVRKNESQGWTNPSETLYC